ncbi:alpha/beta hydrolase family esterase [Thermodesulfobacteriota bacterium]
MNRKKIVFGVTVLCLAGAAACADLFFRSAGCGSGSEVTTGEHTIISNGVERVYYLKLPAQYSADTQYPLIFAFHGFTSNYTVFSEGEYDLQDAVGEEALLVYPNAQELNGEPQWDYEADLGFFDDLYAELEAALCFDTRKVFAIGHSNGAGFTHTLGCKRGNVLRAIGPVAGSFADQEGCAGQVAVMMIHGDNDTIMPPGVTIPTLDYWTAINSCSIEGGELSEGPGPDAVCESYSGCDPDYPVRHCSHSGGHEWPDSAGAAIWDFFSSLPEAAPSSSTGSGGGPATVRGVASFKVAYPSDFVGTPFKLALSLYPSGSAQPFSGGPSYILSMDIPLGEYTLGEVTAYEDVRINLRGVDYGDYALALSIYVEGSSYPIPASGIDYMGLQEITLDSSTIVVEEPFQLEFVVY